MMNEPTQQQPPIKRKKRKGRIFLITLIVFLATICLALLAGAGAFFYYVKDTPELDFVKLEDTLSSTIYDASKNPILKLGEKNREVIEANEIPDTLKQSIISIEDKRFEKHIGIDPIRIAGAAISNLKGNSRQGGSTLTQQLIKLSYFSSKQEDQTIRRKAQEAWLAMKLEKSKSKDEILTYYINRVYMSNGVYGMKTAAETFYGKNLDELSLAQTALLAGIPQSPSDYDPYNSPDDAKKRRDLVLSEMKKDGKITEDQYKEAVAVPIDDGLINLEEDTSIQKVTDNYINEVIKEVEKTTNKNVYTDGLEVYTNLDLEAQTYLYNLVNNENSSINFPDDSFQVSGTLIDVKTGKVTAQIGGRKTEDVSRGANRAVDSKRDFGSTSKPLVAYAPSIEYLDYGSGQIYADEPYKYSSGVSVYDYDKQYRGRLTMRESLIDSRNIPALKALAEVGNDKAKDFISKLGLDNDVYESSAISMQGSSLQLAASYAAFANGGVYYTPTYVNKIVYSDGTEEEFQPEGTRAMKESTAYIITDMLKDVIAKGTGTNAQIPTIIQAGKTGTSNYDDDALQNVDGEGNPDISFVGYTPKYSFAVWTGYDEYLTPIQLKDQQLASDIYRNFMTFLYADLEATDWKMPDDVIRSGGEVYLKGSVGSQNTTSSKSSSSASETDASSSSESTKPESSKSTEPSSSSVTPSSSIEPTPSSEEPTEPSSSVAPAPVPSSSEPPASSESQPSSSAPQDDKVVNKKE